MRKLDLSFLSATDLWSGILRQMSLRTQVFICVKVRQTSWTTSPKQFVINDSFESLLLNLLVIAGDWSLASSQLLSVVFTLAEFSCFVGSLWPWWSLWTVYTLWTYYPLDTLCSIESSRSSWSDRSLRSIETVLSDRALELTHVL